MMQPSPDVIASETKQSIGTASSVTMDCFVAEPVIGRAFRAPRWLLAMTDETRATTSRFRIDPLRGPSGMTTTI
jgi:hypothetical protein